MSHEHHAHKEFKAMPEEVVRLDTVSKTYEPNGAEGIKNVSMTIFENEFVSLMGPSGCGKSTILKLIAGLTEPTTGTIKRPTQVSLVFQSGALFPWLTALENAAFGLVMKGMAEMEAQQKALEKLEMLKLSSRAKDYPRQLSGGQRQRVGIARALAVEPTVLLLDEPFSALDEGTRIDLYQDLLEIWKPHTLTIVMVSHQADETAYLAQRAIVMEDHQIKKEMHIGLAYPRDMQSDHFSRKVNEIRNQLFTMPVVEHHD